MKMLFAADLHYTLKQLDWLVANAGRYDLVIIGGDLLDLGSALDFDVQIVVVEKYLHRIRRHAPLLVSSGNHDGDSRNAADESVAEWLLLSRADGLYVDGESAVFGDLRVTACPWWDGPTSRAELAMLLEREAATNTGRWIWSHHAPPAGARVCWSGKNFLGDPYLLEWINRFKPDLVLSGHIHNAPFYPEGSWIDRIGHTWVFNPGRQPGPIPTHLNLDLDAMSAEWIAAEGESIRQLGLSNR
jgi:Icc-related predicted phosphoesterase